MIKTFIGITLLAVATLIYSCDPFFDCEKIDDLAVFDDLRNVDSIEYVSSSVVLKAEAFDTVYNGMPVFINSNAEYQALKMRAAANDCEGCLFPNIDFSNRSLIGQYYAIRCDDLALQRFVRTSDTTFAFYSKAINTGECDVTVCANSTYNLMLVPKIDSLAQVEFFHGESFYECDCD